MSGVSRFLSRRDKRPYAGRNKVNRISLKSLLPEVPEARARPKFTPIIVRLDSWIKLLNLSVPFYGLFLLDEHKKKLSREEEHKIKDILRRLNSVGVTSIKEAQAEYAFRSASTNGDIYAAVELLIVLDASFNGDLTKCSPGSKLLGAENRECVTCYLDSVLFAMFAKLDGFDALLFKSSKDEARQKLVFLIRLWVNMLRTGKLITVDITKHLQETLAACGWEDAERLRQQDASEAFTFITGQLEVPLLTLKMDIYHTGKEDAADDHKYINERLLEVAIPTDLPMHSVVTLEECLERYFNNRIEVKRHLQRKNTFQSSGSTEKSSLQVEAEELSPTTESSGLELSRTQSNALTRPLRSRTRGDSIFSERRIDTGRSTEKKEAASGRPRKSSLRKEVMMPAWQFFSLIPWYTDEAPMNDLQVATHFSTQRPLLGITLKRYFIKDDGTPSRLDTQIDIPLEIGLPHFISDDSLEGGGPLFGNFKLSLQSVVCHRGSSLNSGHYVTLVREIDATSNTPNHASTSFSHHDAERNDNYSSWLRFDDLAKERVVSVDILSALKDEVPYLLFYQVQPIDEEIIARGEPPPYTESAPLSDQTNQSREPSFKTCADVSAAASGTIQTKWEPPTSAKPTAAIETPRGRSSMSSFNRQSDFLDGAAPAMDGRVHTAPSTPADENRTGWLSASRRGSKPSKMGSKSRPSSQSGESRLSVSVSRITSRISRDKLSVSGESSSVLVADFKSEDLTPVSVSPVPEEAKEIKREMITRKDEVTPRAKTKREKRKNRDSLHLDRSMFKIKSPDRECSVM